MATKLDYIYVDRPPDKKTGKLSVPNEKILKDKTPKDKPL